MEKINNVSLIIDVFKQIIAYLEAAEPKNPSPNLENEMEELQDKIKCVELANGFLGDDSDKKEMEELKKIIVKLEGGTSGEVIKMLVQEMFLAKEKLNILNDILINLKGFVDCIARKHENDHFLSEVTPAISSYIIQYRRLPG